ncbi:aminotransferase class V-fold PLP-dependent enzyme [Jiella endophytica]
MNVPMEDQRSPDLPDLTLGLFRDLKRAFRNDGGRVFMFPSSGTGSWEAAIQNTLAPGDRVLMARFGQFSHLWVEMAQRLGLDVTAIDVEWGKGVPLDAYEQAIGADHGHEIRAVFVTHNETATGVTSDIAGVRKLLDAHSHPALLFVDGVSSIASIDFRQDEWGVDLAVAGSQKGFMLPAGLSFLSVSEKALAASRDNRPKLPRSYFLFADQIAMNDQGYFPYTPPTQFFHGLRASLDMLFEEGLDNVFARHHRLAEGIRRGVRGLGLDLVAAGPEWYSDTVSAIFVPEGVDANQVLKIAYERYATSFGGGLARLNGRVFRIGHLGDLNEVMCLGALAAAEISLADAGAKITPGAGVAAAHDWYRKANAGADARLSNG